ncbi:MAG: hypothetical protein ACE5EX_11805 [Phycisphaerae bacterium]
MSKVDQFESMFRAAARDMYAHEPVEIGSVLVITDLDEAGARLFGEAVRRFLRVIDNAGTVRWRDVTGPEFSTAGELLALVESAGPDLICTYRNLHSSAWKWPYSLGTHLDLLTQHTGIPVMVLPHPKAGRGAGHAMENTNAVTAITDHLAGDQRLVNHAVSFTEPSGTLWLTHVEDEATFERYMEAIGKISSIDTDEASEAIRQRLLVAFGHHLSEYRRIIETLEVDLLVLNTRKEDQLAMHGMAYALAVELRHIPLLML